MYGMHNQLMPAKADIQDNRHPPGHRAHFRHLNILENKRENTTPGQAGLFDGWRM